jgi:phospholipid/cholesterol/gamma-HCH transport system substrate-binding protein
VAADTPVRKDGILIGKVLRVRFADDDPRFETQSGVIVTISINADRRIRANERCRITSTLLGDAVLQFVPGSQHASNELLQNGDYIEGTVSANPLQMFTNMQNDIGQAITSVAGAGHEMGKLAENLNRFLNTNDDQLQRIVSKTERALDSFQQTLDGVNMFMGNGQVAMNDKLPPGDPTNEAELRKQLITLPELMKEINETIVKMGKTVDTANRTMTNLEHFTQPLGDRGDELIDKVDHSVSHLDELLQQLVMFSQGLNQNKGTIGLLLKDPQLYNNLKAASANFKKITCQVQPILHNVEVFTDKIARHPGVILRDAAKPGPGIK